MAGEVPKIKEDVQALATSADKDSNKKIEESERRLEAENFGITERLRAILKSDDKIKKQALDQAIREVAAKYQGLSSADIYRWIENPAEPERAPDIHRFGRVPEEHPTERHLNELWEGMDARERVDALREGLRNVETMRRRHEQLMILAQGVDGLRTTAEKGGNTIGEKIGFWITGKAGVVDREAIQRNANEFLNKVPDLTKTIQKNPDSTLRDILNKSGYGKWADYFLRAGILFEEPRNDADLLKDQLQMVRFLRKIGDYQMARTMAQEALAPRFAGARDRHFKTALRQVRVGNETFSAHVIPDLYQKSHDRIFYKLAVSIGEFRIKNNPHLDLKKYQERIDEVTDALAYQDYLHYEHERVGEEINREGLDEKWSSAEQAIFKEFKDSMGIGALDLADENWDFLIDEVCINAPLIVASGFAASFARAMAGRTISAGARAVLGVARVERIAQVSGRLGRVAAWGTGLTFEAGVFSTTHEALQGRWIGNAPDWASQWAQSAVFLGTFKGAGQLGKKLAESAKGMVAGIRHPAVLKAAQGFLANGTEFGTEVAAMLALGAVANGAHSSDWEEFAANYDFAQELFRALVTAGALKVSGVATKKAAGRFKKPPQGGAKPKDFAREPAKDPDLREQHMTTDKTSDGKEFNPYYAKGTVNGVEIECIWDRAGDAHIVSVITPGGGRQSVRLGKSQHHAERLTRYIAELARNDMKADEIAELLPNFVQLTKPLPAPRPARQALHAEPAYRHRRTSPLGGRQRVLRPETARSSVPAFKDGFVTPLQRSEGMPRQVYVAEGIVNGVKISCEWGKAGETEGYVLKIGSGNRVFLGKDGDFAKQVTKRVRKLVEEGENAQAIAANLNDFRRLTAEETRTATPVRGTSTSEARTVMEHPPAPRRPFRRVVFSENFPDTGEAALSKFPRMPRTVYSAEGVIEGTKISCGWGKAENSEGYFLRIGNNRPIFLDGSTEFARNVMGRARRMAERGQSPEKVYQTLINLGELVSGNIETPFPEEAPTLARRARHLRPSAGGEAQPGL